MKKLQLLFIVAMATTLTALAEDATFETITEALNYTGDKSAVTKLIITGTIAGDDYSDDSEWSKFLYLDETFPSLESVEILTEQAIPDAFRSSDTSLFRGLFWHYSKQPYQMVITNWLKNFSAPNVKSVGNHNFNSCYSLESVDFPVVTTIGYAAFGSCSKLKSAEFPSAIKIDTSAFGSCVSLKSLSFPSCTDIRWFAFYDCYNLESVSFPVLTIINHWAFMYCRHLKLLYFPVATKIGTSAFEGCVSLESLDFPLVSDIGSGAFEDCVSLESLDFPLVSDIGGGAFSGCYRLEAIDFPFVRGIGRAAFSGCYGLTSVSLGTGFTTTQRISLWDSVFFYYSNSITPNIDLTLGKYVLPVFNSDDRTWQTALTDRMGEIDLGDPYIWKSITIHNGITDHSIATHFTISPNPTSIDAVANFGLLESGEITIEVCDLLGECFYSTTNFYDAGEHSVILQIKGIPSGNYICRLLSKGKQIGTEGFVVGR